MATDDGITNLIIRNFLTIFYRQKVFLRKLVSEALRRLPAFNSKVIFMVVIKLKILNWVYTSFGSPTWGPQKLTESLFFVISLLPKQDASLTHSHMATTKIIRFLKSTGKLLHSKLLSGVCYSIIFRGYIP